MVRLAEAPFDLIKQVEPVQGVSDFGVVGEILKDPQDLLPRFRGTSPFLPHILAPCIRESQFASLSDGGQYPTANPRPA